MLAIVSTSLARFVGVCVLFVVSCGCVSRAYADPASRRRVAPAIYAGVAGLGAGALHFALFGVSASQRRPSPMMPPLAGPVGVDEYGRPYQLSAPVMGARLSPAMSAQLVLAITHVLASSLSFGVARLDARTSGPIARLSRRMHASGRGLGFQSRF